MANGVMGVAYCEHEDDLVSLHAPNSEPRTRTKEEEVDT